MEWGYEANHPFDERCAGQGRIFVGPRAYRPTRQRSPFLACFYLTSLSMQMWQPGRCRRQFLRLPRHKQLEQRRKIPGVQLTDAEAWLFFSFLRNVAHIHRFRRFPISYSFLRQTGRTHNCIVNTRQAALSAVQHGGLGLLVRPSGSRSSCHDSSRGIQLTSPFRISCLTRQPIGGTMDTPSHSVSATRGYWPPRATPGIKIPRWGAFTSGHDKCDTSFVLSQASY